MYWVSQRERATFVASVVSRQDLERFLINRVEVSTTPTLVLEPKIFETIRKAELYLSGKGWTYINSRNFFKYGNVKMEN